MRVVLALMVCVLSPGVAAADNWHGHIQCTTLPGFTSKSLYGAFEIMVDGGRISYRRPVLNPDATSSSGIFEVGTGTIVAGEVRLEGHAAATGYHYESGYVGRVDGRRMQLSGEQVWTAKQYAQPYHRKCGIEMERE